MDRYYVLTGDIIQSRNYDNFSEKIKQGLSQVDYPEQMVTPFKISRGDEIQSVFEFPASFPRIIRQVRYLLRPLEVRFGVGLGEVDHITGDADSWEMNGPAFYNARSSLEFLEENKNFKTRFTAGNSGDRAVNTILYLIDTLQEDWTDSQWEAIYYYEREETYKKAAQKLNIAFQNVEKRCRAARWKEVKYAEDRVTTIIDDFLSVGE